MCRPAPTSRSRCRTIFVTHRSGHVDTVVWSWLVDSGLISSVLVLVACDESECDPLRPPFVACGSVTAHVCAAGGRLGTAYPGYASRRLSVSSSYIGFGFDPLHGRHATAGSVHSFLDFTLDRMGAGQCCMFLAVSISTRSSTISWAAPPSLRSRRLPMHIADTTYRQLGRTSAFMRNLLAAGCHQ